MKELHTKMKKGRMAPELKQRKQTEGKLKKGVLMPEKPALANKLPAGVKLPDEPERR